MQEQSKETATQRRFKWGFASCAGVILALLVVGQVAGELLSRWPPMRGLLRSMGAFSGQGVFRGSVLEAMVVRDWLFGAFMIAAAAVAWLNRDSIVRFFRTMQTGVALIVLSTVAVLTGVLVPQIEGFEDPQQRVTVANRAEEMSKFRWAEGYFFYHLTHLYGIGMPTAELPPQVLEGLDRFGRAYGAEEQKNRQVMMSAAFSGQAKTGEIEAFIKRHSAKLDRAFAVCTALDFNRTYKSAWFTTLMTLLGLGVLSNTFRYPLRRLLSAEKAGYFVTHLGMLTLLCGGLVSNLFTDRGILELRLGEPPEDTYYRHYRADKLSRMPFGVQLDRFARKEWKAVEVHFLQEEQFKSKLPLYTVWAGRTIPLDWKPGPSGELEPQVELVVREVHEHAIVGDPKISEGRPGDGGPTLAVVQFDAPASRASDEHSHKPSTTTGRRTLYMAPEFANQVWTDPAGNFRLAVAHGVDPRTIFPQEGDDTFASLFVDVLSEGQDAPQSLRIRVGDRLQLPGGYQIVVQAATRDFKPGRDSEAGSGETRPLADQPDGFRAVWLDVLPPDGKESERRLVSEVVDPVENGLQEDYKYKDVVVRLRWDRWTELGSPRYVFSWNAAGEGRLVAQAGGDQAVAIGQELELPGETQLVLQGLYDRARFEKSIEFPPKRLDPDGFDPSFYETDSRGIVLDVVRFPRTPKQTIETVRMATSPDAQANLWKSGDDTLGISFLENEEGFPFDWRSVLSIVEKDANGKSYTVDCGTPKQREIRVNDYFKYKGYRFFQTNANAKDPNYSGIGVVYDPGIEIVLLGMYTIIAGTVLAFLVRPIVRARQRAKVQEAAA